MLANSAAQPNASESSTPTVVCNVVFAHWCLTAERKSFKTQGCWEENKFPFKYAVYEGSTEQLGGIDFLGYMDIWVWSSGDGLRWRAACGSSPRMRKVDPVQNCEEPQDTRDQQRYQQRTIRNSSPRGSRSRKKDFQGVPIMAQQKRV